MKCLVCKTEISEDEEFEITIKVDGVEAKLCNRCGKKLAAEMVERGASIEAQMETPPEL